MAAARPTAVANSASAIPGATTARLVSFVCAIAVNEFMMPQTVPKRPMNGAADPSVARNGRPRLDVFQLPLGRAAHGELETIAHFSAGGVARAFGPFGARRFAHRSERVRSRLAGFGSARFAVRFENTDFAIEQPDPDELLEHRAPS